MKNYYILKDCRISRKGNSIMISIRGEDKKIPIPINDIDSIFIFGEVDLNTKAINFLSKNNIIIHFFNYYGWYTGSFYPKEFLLSGDMIIKQSEHYLNNENRLKIAKQFVKGAVHGSIQNLKRYNCVDIEKRLEEYNHLIDEQKDIASLMGVEGNCKEVYYKAFPEIIKQEIDFEKRVKHPPDNMMNAFISFMNGLMYAETLKEIYKTQLNPTISYLHEPSCRRFSLALDISEIFKPIYTDRVIFDLMNNNKITKEHFDKNLNYAYLKDDGRKIVAKAFEEKLTTTFFHRTLKKKVSYKQIIRLELYKLIKHLLGDKDYECFKIWW